MNARMRVRDAGLPEQLSPQLFRVTTTFRDGDVGGATGPASQRMGIRHDKVVGGIHSCGQGQDVRCGNGGQVDRCHAPLRNVPPLDHQLIGPLIRVEQGDA